jgi:hypothetical protein
MGLRLREYKPEDGVYEVQCDGCIGSVDCGGDIADTLEWAEKYNYKEVDGLFLCPDCQENTQLLNAHFEKGKQ